MGCVNMDVKDERAGCTYLDGKGRYGLMFTNYIKGEGKGAHVYVGKKVPKGLKITCNANTQEVLINYAE